MDFNTQVAELLKKTKSHTDLTQNELKDLVSVIDLTSLNPEDDEESIQKLVFKSVTPLGPVAAICVYPKFVAQISKGLQELKNKNIRIASVANFPTGSQGLETAIKDIHFAIDSGANEMDVVFPFMLYLKGQKKEALNFIEQCKAACGKILLKVILEISEFDKLDTLYALSKEVITAGADFIKTSTGKSRHGATLEGSSAMLLAIKSCSRKNVGFKASGGIKTLEQAISYIDLAKAILGEDWVKPQHFRIGASSLLDNIIAAS